MNYEIMRCLIFILFLAIKFSSSHAADRDELLPETKARTHAQLDREEKDETSSLSVEARIKSDQTLPAKAVINLGNKPVEQLLASIGGLVGSVIDQEHPLVKVHVLVTQDYLGDFHTGFSEIVAKRRFPFTWSTENKGIIAKSSPPIHKLELRLSSHAKLRRQVEHEFVYKVSEADQKKLHWELIYDLVMRSNFSVNDFRFNKALKVRLLTLEEKDAEANVREMHRFIKGRLPRDTEPFHIVGFDTSQIDLKAGELLSHFSHASALDNNIEQRGMIYDDKKGWIYVCLTNASREMLDLHGTKKAGKYDGRTVKDAEPETAEFVQNAFYNFQDTVTVLTGRGKHGNNGKKGVLKKAFKEQWTKDLAPFIAKFHPVTGDGGYKVKLRKAPRFDVKGMTLKDAIPRLHTAVTEAAKGGHDRLRVLLDPANTGASEAVGGVLLVRYSHSLALSGQDFSFSIVTVPGELRLIFDKAPTLLVRKKS